MALCLALRSSYDRSIGLAVGAGVFICYNLSLQGETLVMKKLTKDITLALEHTCIQTLF